MSEPGVARELDITLERNSPVPLYYQLAQAIENEPSTPGASLPATDSRTSCP